MMMQRNRIGRMIIFCCDIKSLNDTFPLLLSIKERVFVVLRPWPVAETSDIEEIDRTGRYCLVSASLQTSRIAL